MPFAIEMLPLAEPALLVALAQDPASTPDIRLGAAEAATRLNAFSPDELAQVYRSAATAETADMLLSGNAASSGPNRRAALFKSAETEHTPMKKTRLICALIDDARRSGLALQTMQMSAKAAESLNPQPEISWFAETGAEIGLASANSALTAKWVALAGSANPAMNPLQHWLALEDLGDAAYNTCRSWKSWPNTGGLRPMPCTAWSRYWTRSATISRYRFGKQLAARRSPRPATCQQPASYRNCRMRRPKKNLAAPFCWP